MSRKVVFSPKRRAALGAVAALPLLGLSACGGSSDVSSKPSPTPTPGSQAKTTLLVYMVASDLETRGEAATLNIAQMKQAAGSSDVQVLLQTGGSESAGFQRTMRSQLKDKQLQTIQDLGATDMGLPATLVDFITWGVQTYPADQYMLVLWDHGGGPIWGFGADENTGNHITGIQLVDAMKSAHAATNVQFELIGFDACLMASVEVAAALVPYGHYLLASQDIEPGEGWEYTSLINALTANPSQDGATFGKTIIDGYYAQNSHGNDNNLLTASLVDLTKIGPITTSLSTVAEQWRQQIASEGVSGWSPLLAARNDADRFQSSRLPLPFQYELFDLGQLVASPYATSGTAGAALQTALSNAVIYKRNGAGHGDATGLTVYFPAQGLTEIQPKQTQTQVQRYLNANAIPGYSSFLEAHRDFVAASTEIKPVLTPLTLQNGSYQGTFSNAWGSTAQFGVLMDPTGQFVQSVMDLVPDGDGTLSLPPSTAWPTLNGQPVLLQREWSPSSSQVAKDVPGRYSIPVYFEWKDGDDGLSGGILRLSIDSITGETVLHDLLEVGLQDAGPSASRGVDIASVPGLIRSIAPLYFTTGGRFALSSQPLDFSNGFTVGSAAVAAGSHLVTVGVSDYAGRWTLAANPQPSN
ncbi:clostripain-related cysteine peptidase [Chitinasiproducens palmae]|uniref:clostripain-related cysteine peptidase n=1 Tax=Chitinasiproducens palmae TaxID=1770053 RepID=UPI001481AE26|nr:clostripain-related cysteine peptidase [Chitinasiproducens palmae]